MKSLLMIIFLMAMSAIAISGCAPIPVEGQVFANDGRPLAGAFVADDMTYVKSNACGFYRISVPNCGETIFSIKARNYHFDQVSLFLPLATDSPYWGSDDIVHLNFYARP